MSAWAFLIGGALLVACVLLALRHNTLAKSVKNKGAIDVEKATTPTSSRRTLRQLGYALGALPAGANNAITDVAGVCVGHTTVCFGEGKLVPGEGPARTGVTAITCGDMWNNRLSAGSFVLNGNGCVTGLDWLKESGLLEGPILLTNTLSVGTVYDAAITWLLQQHPQIGVEDDTCLPVVGECDDSSLNDIRGRHVKERHVLEALSSAKSGPVQQGAVGAGSGMICYEFKGGIGSSSRVLDKDAGGFTVGVLVNCNHGERRQLRIDGLPVGRMLQTELASQHREGSICIVVATDAPLTSLQLDRLARRAALGLARTGAIAQNESGDFIIAFSTTRTVARDETATVASRPEVTFGYLNTLFEAAAEATEEAVINALCCAQTVVGRDGNVAPALPVDHCLRLLQQNRNDGVLP